MTDAKELSQILGENLKRLRKEKGLSRKQIADKLNVSTMTLSLYERGVNLPATDKLVELSKILECSIDEITGNTAAIDRKIFQYRYQWAKKMAENYLHFTNRDLEPNQNGHIVVFTPVRLEYKNGIVSSYGANDENGGYVGNTIGFRTEKDFVEVMERSERDALYQQIPFYKAFRRIVFADES